MGRNHPTEGEPTANLIVLLSVGGNIVVIILMLFLVGYGGLWKRKRRVQDKPVRGREGEERRLMNLPVPQDADELEESSDTNQQERGLKFPAVHVESEEKKAEKGHF